MRLNFVLISSLLFSQFANAQFQLSARKPNADSLYSRTPHYWNGLHFYRKDSVAPEKFPVKSFIIPGVLIAYGFVAYRLDPTLDLDESIQEEVSHPQTHIDNYLQFVPAVAVYGLDLVGIKAKNNFVDRSLIYVMSSVISNSVVFVLKNWTHELRPDGSDYYSFPSGHTTQAFVSAEFLYQEYKDKSPWYGVAGYAVATSVGFLRIYNDKHWFHDVVAGAGFGMASTKLTYWLYPKIKRLFSKNKQMNTLVMPTYNGSYGLALVHLF
ncbi:MAG: phosphoesterase [Bacteroidetes bacterium]|nr:MAG: phosphoesterase [Bacteroidota bacterium]